MTFVLCVDCDADDTFERVAAIRLPLEASRSLNYVVAMAVSVHNLDFVMPADPCTCQSIRVQAKAVEKQAKIFNYVLMTNAIDSIVISYLAVVSSAARTLSITIAMIGVRFHLCQSVAIINAWMCQCIISDVTLLFAVICYCTNCLILFH